MVGEQATNPVRTSQMTLRVLEGIETLQGATLTSLASHLDEPKSTVHNHLSTLLEKKYIVQEDNEYHLGLRFTELGEQSKNRHKLYSVGKSEVDELAETTGELANLAVVEHGQAVYLHRASGENAISTDTYSGKRVLPHCTSLGKAMLAYMPDDRVNVIIDQYGLPSRTEHTITDRDELFEELTQIHDDGVAFDDEERGYGIRCVAAPILNRESQHPVGAVSLSVPVNRTKTTWFTDEIPSLLQQVVNVIEIELTYSRRNQ